MGYDFVSKNPDARDDDYCHLNISAMQYLRALLKELKVNDSNIAYTNDGDLITSKQSKQWGNAIIKALNEDRIVNLHKSNNMYSRGYEEIPFILDKGYSLMTKEEKFVEALDNTYYPLSKDDKQWLQGLANYFIRSGGFRQY